MNQLKYPCFYPGDFAPPTKMHLNTLYWLLSKPEVGHVSVVIGAKPTDGVTSEQKKALWEMLLRSTTAPQATILVSKEKGPLSEVYDNMMKRKEMPCFIALDESSSRNKRFQEKFEIFPNYGIQLIPSQFKKSSERARQAIDSGDTERLKLELPKDFNQDMVDSYVRILSAKNDPEAPEEQSKDIDYKNRYESMFNDGFWKNVFLPIVNDPKV